MASTIAAFFDVDNTLIDLKSMFSFLDFLEVEVGSLSSAFARDCQKIRRGMLMPNSSREQLNRFYYRILSDFPVDEIDRLGRKWYELTFNEASHYIADTVDKLKSHQAQGHLIVFVSGSFDGLLRPIAEDLGVTHILATDLEQDNHRYTGFLLSEPTIGEGKARRMREFAKRQGIDLAHSYAYGDDISDQAMLSCVGCPNLVNPSDALVKQYQKLLTMPFTVLRAT